MHNDLTFFTNEPERDLYSRFSTILKSNTQFFDVLVGYFRTSGFFKLKDAMECVEKYDIRDWTPNHEKMGDGGDLSMDSILKEKWFELSLAQQMVNIGNEVKRGLKFYSDPNKRNMFFERAIH